MNKLQALLAELSPVDPREDAWSARSKKISAAQKGVKDGPMSEEEKAKRRGKKMSPEVIARVAAKNTGRKNTAETIAKMKLAHVGKHPKSAEVRAKISKTLTGRARPDIAELLRGRQLSEESIAKRSATLAANAHSRREAKFAAHREALEASLVNPVMLPAGHRVDLKATCLKYGIPLEMRAHFVGLRKKGYL